MVEGSFRSYLPRLARDWSARPEERHRAIEGSLVSVDISGFTRLSERLAAKGRAGAEELIHLLSSCFEGLIGIAESRGGDVLKFRGDALLILFSETGHERRACRAAAAMLALIERTERTPSSIGPVALRMSTGIYSGRCDFFLVEADHRDLLVTGPAATETVRLEQAARAGQILVSAATAAALEPAALGPQRGGARLLRPARLGGEDPMPRWADPAGAGLEVFVPAALRGRLAAGAEEGEHRQAAVAFVRFSGADALLSAEGAGAVLERLQALAQAVGEATAAPGLTWLESDIDVDGGKLYLTAGAPASGGADEERMLRALRAILDAGGDVELRAGVTRGHVFAGDIGAPTRRTYAVMGDVVNLAARLTAQARPGQILAAAEVLERSRARFAAEPQPFLVKGKERPVTAFSVGALAAAAAERSPAEKFALVGRTAELEELRAALGGARRRTSQFVEIVGEPGIGKSRLVEELLALASGFTHLIRCEQYSASTPYFAFRGLLRMLVGIAPDEGAVAAGEQLAGWIEAVMPDLAPWLPLLAIPFGAEIPATPETEQLDAAFRRERLLQALEDFLQRVLLMPTLIVVEDAHWLDDASREILRHLNARRAQRPWLICLTQRPHVEGLIRGRGAPGVELRLEPLGPQETALLALEVAGERALSEEDVAAVSARSGGNPLFLRELVASQAHEGALPETVETLVTTRIDTLDPSDQALLRHAAVIGSTFDLELLAEIVPGEPLDPARLERLAEFVAAGEGGALRFRQDLFRTVAYEGLSYRRRREAHGLVAEALERRDGEAAAELLSVHFYEAERYDRSWRYAVVAGDRARAGYANVVAAQLYARALDAAARLPGLDPPEVARVSEGRGDVAELAARYDEAAAAYRRARGLLPGDGLAQTRLMLKEGVLRERAGRYTDALRMYGRGLKVAGALGTGGLAARAQLELGYAGVRFRQGRYLDSIRWSRRAARHAQQAGDRSALAHARYLLGTAENEIGRAGQAALESAVEMLGETGELVLQANALNNLGIAAYYKGRWDEALEYYRRGGEVSRRAGDVVNAARAGNNEAEILSDQGRVAEAQRLLEEALRIWRAAGYTVGVALATSNLGRAAARAGRFEEAHRLLDEALRDFGQIGAESFVLDTDARRAECLVFEGRHREALRQTTALLARVERSGWMGAIAAWLERLRGYALLQAREPRRAREPFEASLALARELGARYELALTLLGLAELPGAGAEAAEAGEILAGLGVVSTPRIPLP